MSVFIAELAILLIVLTALAYPLAGVAGLRAAPELAESELSDLLYRKESAYTALKDLEFDMRTGKIGKDDYEAIKASLEAEAISLLGLIDAAGRGAASSPKGEKEERKKGKFCQECGVKLEKPAKFCPECGHKL
jgi:hypothetical protein